MTRPSLLARRRLNPLQTFSAFHDPSYRLLWGSNLLSYVSRWMQVFILSLFILDRTDSPFLVALVAFFAMIPMLVLGVFGGILADRMNRRHLLMITQGSNFVTTLVMTLLLVAEVVLERQIVVYWHAYILLLVTGIGWALDMPSRRSIVLDLLGRSRVTNGIALDSVGMQVSQMLGPFMAGALVSFVSFLGGYTMITAFYFVSVGLMWAVKLSPRTRTGEVTSTNILRNLMEGFKYVRGHNTIMAVIVVTILMNLLVFPYQQMVPVIGRNVLQLEPWTIGILQGISGLGALIGSVLIASASSMTYQGRVYLGGSLLTLFMLLLFSLSRSYALSLPILVILGLGSAGFGTMQSTIVILAAREEMRGRALGVLTLAIGAGPIGALMIGALATATSPTTAITINAITGLIVLGFVAVTMSSLRQRIASDDGQAQTIPDPIPPKTPA